MASRDNLIVLAQTIGGLTGSTATLGRAYDEINENLCKLGSPPIVYSSGLAVTTNTEGRFTYPTTGVEVLAVFYENRQLRPTMKSGLETWDSTWRGSTAEPLVYYKEEESGYRSIRMVPLPTTATTGAWIYTKIPTEVPDYMNLYVAFKMLEREYARLSDHQDKEFAQVCGQAAQLFALLIGL